MESTKNVFVMMEIELRRISHDKQELLTRAIQPVLYLVIFGPIMSGVRAFPITIPYEAFITPGILLQSTTMISVQFGIAIIFERESGVLKKLIVSPASRYSIVIGRAMSAGTRSMFQFLIIIPVALLMGVAFVPNPLNFIVAFALVFFTSAGFAAVSIFIASLLKTRERFMGVTQAIVQPLFFASNALYPITMMPPVLQTIALFNPMSYTIDGLRGLIITGDTSSLLIDIAAIAVFDVIIFLAASLNFKKIIE